MTLINLPVSAWPYPTKKPVIQFGAWSSCGLYAHALNRTVSIFTDDFGRFVLMVVLPPFEENIAAIAC
jgi:hypothetical protein